MKWDITYLQLNENADFKEGIISKDLKKLMLFEDRGTHIYKMKLNEREFDIDLKSKVEIKNYQKDIIYAPLWNNKLLQNEPWMKPDGIFFCSSTNP